MSTRANTYKTAEPVVVEKEAPKSVFDAIPLKKFDMRLDQAMAIKYLPYFGFLTVLGILYVANVHYAERLVRNFTQLNKEVERLRVDYGSLKYEYINASRQGEIANQVKPIGLIENREPVYQLKGENLKKSK